MRQKAISIWIRSRDTLRQKASQKHNRPCRQQPFQNQAVIRRTANAVPSVGAAAGVVDVATAVIAVLSEGRSAHPTGFPNEHPNRVWRVPSSLRRFVRWNPPDPSPPGRLPGTSPWSCQASRFPSTND